MMLVAVAAAVLLAAACGSDGDSVDRAELEAREAQERTEELELQLEQGEDEELRQELEDLQDQLAEEGAVATPKARTVAMTPAGPRAAVGTRG
jgi:hypothetical protein